MQPARRLSPQLSLLAAALVVVIAACNPDPTPPTLAAQQPAPAATPAPTPAAPGTPAPADAQMQAVLDQLATLGGKPIETLTPAQARQQPSPADAVVSLLQSQNKASTPEDVARVQNSTFPGPGGAVPIRIYTPEGAGEGPLPVIHYIHGGGWVIADLDTYDASPRALANAAKAIVISTHYRQAPEHPFPAAHGDSLAAYQWILKNAGKFGGDPKRVAVVGESAGGNMAANIAIAARDNQWQAPLHQVLVYPVADNDLNSPSYVENANAKPLNKAMIEWFVKHYLGGPDKAADPRIALVDQPNHANLAPATIILAQIDPLRSDGEKYAEKLRAAGVPVTVQVYDGVTHEFFGMGATVDKAKQAQQLAGEKLRAAFASGSAAGETAAQ